MNSGRIAVSNNSFYCGAVDGAVCQLALKTDIPEPVDMSNYVTKEELEEAIGVQAKIVGSYTFDTAEKKTVTQCDYVELVSFVGATSSGTGVALTSMKTIVFKGGSAYIFGKGTGLPNGVTANLSSNGTSLNVTKEEGTSIFVTAVCYKYV